VQCLRKIASHLEVEGLIETVENSQRLCPVLEYTRIVAAPRAFNHKIQRVTQFFKEDCDKFIGIRCQNAAFLGYGLIA